MKLNVKQSLELAKKYKSKITKSVAKEKEVVACASSIVLPEVYKIIKSSPVKLGAQNVFWEETGTYTGEVSPGMLEEVGCSYVIVGHSERRQYVLENYHMIHQKVKAVLTHDNLIPIVCIGESLKQRESGKRDYVIVEQLQQAFGGINLLPKQQVIVAYEPIWAIGTGQAIKPADADLMHEIIKVALIDIFGVDKVNKQIRIIYGGSVEGKNVKGFSKLANIDGLLVGGASLDAGEFVRIVKGI